MLKAYAVAVALSTTTPVATEKQESADKAPSNQKEVVTQPQTYRPKTGNGLGAGL
ncbi:hypothetical protein OCL06_11265 [Alteromonas sp. ASW11-19]|uniref:Uncharacterized protein n=1 Tax=Alteromonas salexigens TaxID=2982530 RepID=A0ABT2VPD9_9ALTE|nr:hypothetical protein [Alteromonas salexigens]MCU7555175.1 hypothetical protein [Alteromonas salexigens]